MTGGPPDDGFDARLKRAMEARPGAESSAPTDGKASPWGLGARIGVDLVAALAVGVGIGYLLDMWLGTRPWAMVVFFFFGAAAGVLNVYRAVRGMGYGVGYRDPRQPPKE